MASKIAIGVNGVSKTFKLPHEKQTSIKSLVVHLGRHDRGIEKQQVLHNISFEVKEGEFFGIVGRNGSGKSTLLKMLAGIYTPDKGQIDINGKLTPFIELGVGFNPELTGRENVFLNGALLGFNRKQIDGMYDDIVNFAELRRFMDQKLKNYSSGMQVRLAFSIAIRARSDILLLDEVLAVGDAAFQQKCFDYFEDLKRQNQTVVFVSHDMGAVQRFCTKALYIEKGVITKIGSPTDIAEIYREKNMESSDKAPSHKREEPKHSSIEVAVSEHDVEKNRVLFDIKYKTTLNNDVYVGFSILKDGLTFAELNSLRIDSKRKTDTLSYELDISMFNPGVYEISAALLDRNNKSPLAYTAKRARFNIRGFEKIRGGALRLQDTWVKRTS